MRKISSLTQHLIDKTGLPREAFHAFADKGELLPTGKHLGPVRPEPGEEGESREQLEVGIWKYDAVIQVERYPGDGLTLAAVIIGWLADCDPNRGSLADPELNVEINDAETCDVEIAVEFEERLVVVENSEGSVPFMGKMWSMATPEITPATELQSLRGLKV